MATMSKRNYKFWAVLVGTSAILVHGFTVINQVTYGLHELHAVVGGEGWSSLYEPLACT